MSIYTVLIDQYASILLHLNKLVFVYKNTYNLNHFILIFMKLLVD